MGTPRYEDRLPLSRRSIDIPAGQQRAKPLEAFSARVQKNARRQCLSCVVRLSLWKQVHRGLPADVSVACRQVDFNGHCGRIEDHIGNGPVYARDAIRHRIILEGGPGQHRSRERGVPPLKVTKATAKSD